MDTEEQKPRIKNENVSKIILVLAIGIILGFTLGGLFSYQKYYKKFLDIQEATLNMNKQYETSKDSGIDNEVIDNNSNLISRHYIFSDYKTYENTRLGYKLNYPEGLSVYDCPNIACAHITMPDSNIYLEPLRLRSFDKDEIFTNDLYCSAGGPSGETRCDNLYIEEFVNNNGVQGYILKRRKETTYISYENNDPMGSASNVEAQDYDDTVYIFPINISPDYKALLMYVEIPEKANLDELEKVANSFRLVE